MSPVPAWGNTGDTRINRKKAWCSTQHFHRCLQAVFLGVSKPYVLTSFCVVREKFMLLMKLIVNTLLETWNCREQSVLKLCILGDGSEGERGSFDNLKKHFSSAFETCFRHRLRQGILHCVWGPSKGIYLWAEWVLHLLNKYKSAIFRN